MMRPADVETSSAATPFGLFPAPYAEELGVHVAAERSKREGRATGTLTPYWYLFEFHTHSVLRITITFRDFQDAKSDRGSKRAIAL